MLRLWRAPCSSTCRSGGAEKAIFHVAFGDRLAAHRNPDIAVRPRTSGLPLARARSCHSASEGPCSFFKHSHIQATVRCHVCSTVKAEPGTLLRLATKFTKFSLHPDEPCA